MVLLDTADLTAAASLRSFSRLVRDDLRVEGRAAAATRATLPCACQSAAGWVSPVSHAQAAISTRLRTPSLPWMLARWLLTVLREMNSSAAISVLVRPLAMAWTTSISRLDSGAAGRRRPEPGRARVA